MDISKISKFWSIFWLLYVYFFLFIFPCFFIFLDRGDAASGTPELAFSVLISGCILWIAVLLYYLNITLLRILRHRISAKRLLRNGVKRQGIVHHRELLGKTGSTEHLLLHVRFENLSGCRVGKEFTVHDHQPGQYRYAEGKTLSMALDASARAPYAVFEGQQFGKSLSWKITIVSFFLLLAAVPVGILLTSYSFYSFGYGWRFLRFYHPFFYEPVLALVALFFINRFANKPNRNRLLLTGKAAQATVHSFRQTGTYINEQPQIAFEISYRDQQGQLHKAIFKKVVNILHLGSLNRVKTLDVLYNPDKPTDFIVLDKPAY